MTKGAFLWIHCGLVIQTSLTKTTPSDLIQHSAVTLSCTMEKKHYNSRQWPVLSYLRVKCLPTHENRHCVYITRVVHTIIWGCVVHRPYAIGHCIPSVRGLEYASRAQNTLDRVS